MIDDKNNGTNSKIELNKNSNVYEYFWILLHLQTGMYYIDKGKFYF